MTDAADRVLAMNRAAEQMFGVAAQAMVGRPIAALGESADWTWRTQARLGQKDRRPWSSIVELTVGGNRRCFDWSVGCIDGVPGGTVELVREVSQQVRAEHLLHAIFDDSALVLSVNDIETGRFIAVSQEYCKRLGRRREDFLGRDPVEIGIMEAGAHDELKGRLAAQGFVDGLEVEGEHAEGGKRYALIVSRVVLLDGRHCAVTAFQDITALKRAEAELRDKNQRYEETMAGITSVVWHATFDREGNLRDSFNSVEADRMIGLPEGTLRHDPSAIWAHVHPDDLEAARTRLAECIRSPGLVLSHEFRQRRTDGEMLWVRVTARSRLREGGLVQVFGVTEDITAAHRTAEERAQLAQQLQQAQKMESIGRLAGGVAHDFNNLLTAILGNVELVMADLSPADEGRAILAEVAKAAHRGAALTGHLLAFSRMKIIEPKVVNLNDLVGNAERLLVRLLGEDIRFVAALAPSLGSVKADAGQIEQILINLAVNARDAMPGGGTLTVETADVTLDEMYCSRHADAQPGRHVMFAVSDTGMGMTAEVKAHLFEPFFTTKPVGQGTGLGLAMIHGLVRQHGGSIEVYSEVGKGTTFKVYLPTIDEVPVTAESAAEVPLAAGRRETIFLVEDEDAVRRLARKVLSRLDYQVFDFGTAAEALAAAIKHVGTIDLLLTDVILPGENGRWLADRVRAINPGTKVLFTSGYSANVIAHHGVLDAGIQFLEKPYSAAALSQKVRSVLDAREVTTVNSPER